MTGVDSVIGRLRFSCMEYIPDWLNHTGVYS